MDPHNVIPHTEPDGAVSGYFCITCDDWVVPEHSQNTKSNLRKGVEE